MTTITREHLELAAKAARKQIIRIPDKATGELVVHDRHGALWQPHIESLDTWRLAADCEMRIDFKGKYIKHSAGEFHYSDRFGGITAAEAVTLAAAEIGRAMG